MNEHVMNNMNNNTRIEYKQEFQFADLFYCISLGFAQHINLPQTLHTSFHN